MILNRIDRDPCVLYMGSGDISGRWVTCGHEHVDHWSERDIRFHAPDQKQEIFDGRSIRGCRFYTLMIPAADAEEIAVSEGVETLDRLRPVVVTEDAELQWCMMRLASRQHDHQNAVGPTDEACRRLVLRLAQLSGGGIPDWHDDGSSFDRQALSRLVEYIDAHLRIEPCLTDMSMRVGLSPSHFARKFRLSTGLSLHRFVTRRRIQASLESLKDESQPLAHVALDLGFSSQSHFTRLFSDLTGMTPAKYRKQVRRPMG